MGSFLYSNVDDNVREELNARANAIGAVNRTSSTHNWVYQKTAYAKVYNPERDLMMAPPAGGGFDDLYSDSTRYVPDPVLNSVEISNEGRMGSLQKATISFTVFNREQLDEYEVAFMTPGETLEITYGWTTSATDSGQSTDTFTGLVYNFNWNLNNFGGFECSVDVVGEGFKILGMITEANPKIPLISTDAADQGKNYNGFVGLIEYLRDTTISNKEELGEGEIQDGLCYFLLPLSQVDSNEAIQEQRRYYITLEKLVNSINDFYDLVLGEPASTVYVCDDVSTVSQYDSNIFSADPRKIIFPDTSCGQYGSEGTVFESPTILFSEGEVAYLNNTLLEIEWLSEIHESLINGSADESGNISMNQYLNEIFAGISRSTGGIYNLTLITPPGTNEIHVIDTNYTKTDDTIDPFIFKAFRVDSLVRGLSMDSKLPDKMATSMYIAGRGSDATGLNTDVATNITNTEIVPDPDANQNALNVLQESNIKLGDSGFDIESIRECENALIKYKVVAEDKNWNEDVLYPIGLNISFDGVAGFRFGNVVGTDWLPAKYRDKLDGLKVVFVVTNVSHTVSDNDWTTTLETQCRMKL